MAAASREISPTEEEGTLLWKRILEFIIKMTSGLVYSIAMHSLIITAYVLLIFQIFYTNQFDLSEVIGLCYFYLIFIVAEVAVRCFCGDHPMAVTKSGHVAHLYGSIFLTAFMDPLNLIEDILFTSLAASLVWWTLFVLLASFIPAYIAYNQEEGYLTEPLV
ncbi:unnamed protein product [Arabis nemorensis]|uniref:Uncharacterized protein n=1 Tax=Arabis nemorensis TaxID=586526 RepID=A0A565ALR1_9BRAS|nr:unnamed protein product [Arabis nemorensis]